MAALKSKLKRNVLKKKEKKRNWRKKGKKERWEDWERERGNKGWGMRCCDNTVGVIGVIGSALPFMADYFGMQRCHCAPDYLPRHSHRMATVCE